MPALSRHLGGVYGMRFCGGGLGGEALNGEACCDGGAFARGGCDLDCSVE